MAEGKRVRKGPGGFPGLVSSLGLILALGVAAQPLGCGGSGGGVVPAAVRQGDGDVPESVALRIRTCAVKHETHLGSGDRSITFEVQLASNGEVDSIMLRESTLGDEDLELCMVKALRALSEDDLWMRRSDSGPRGPVSPESRSLMGQTQALSCLFSPPCLLAVAFFIGAAYVTVQVFVHAASQSSTANPKPQTAATATAVPTATPAMPLDECIARYVYCTDHTPKVRCDDCLGYCRANRYWPEERCPK